MGMILGYGLCSMVGLFYSAAHTVIPFLLLGIGIDNIFVITQTFNTIGKQSIIFMYFHVIWFLFRIIINPGNTSSSFWADHETCGCCSLCNHLH